MQSVINEILKKDLKTRIDIFKNMFDSISDFVFIMKVIKESNAYQYLYVNRSAKEALGFNESIYGKSIDEVLSPERVKLLKRKYDEVARTKVNVTFDNRYTVGNRLYIGETSLNPLLTENGEVNMILAVVRDITDRKMKEQQLLKIQVEMSKEKQRLNSLIEQNEDAVFEFDLNGKFLDVNEATEQVVGYSKAELINKSYHSVIKSDELSHIKDHFQKAVEGIDQEYEASIYDNEGEKLYLRIKNIPIIVNGKMVGIYGIAKNITKSKKIELQMNKVKDQLQLVWNNTSDAIFLIAQDGSILNVNPTFTNIFGYSEDEVKGLKKLDLIPPHEMESHQQRVQKMRQGEDLSNIEVQRVTKNGEVLHILASYRSINKDGILAVVMYKDITERKRILEHLRASEERYRILIESSPEPILLLKQTKIIFCNSQARKLLGANHTDEVKGRDALEFIHPDDQAITIERTKQIYQGIEKLPLDRRIITLDGRELTLEITAKLIHFEGNQTMLISARDMTERKKAEERVYYLAYHDELTGLGNRRFFKKSLQEMIQKSKEEDESFALITMDIDNFKNINDVFGHDVGDEVLIKLSSLLKVILSDETVITRQGGDEIGILCPNVTKEKIIKIANNIQNEFRIPIQTKNHSMKVDLSMGIALYPDHTNYEDDLELLVKNSDIALYHVKNTGKKHWLLYSDELGESYNKRLFLETQLKEAIKNKEFNLHYQPRIDAETGRINSVEALIRWSKATPDVFIPIAEESGFINEIGEWVIRTACHQMKKWKDKNHPIQKVSINLSIHQLLLDDDFVIKVSNILNEIGLSPKCIEFEITERFFSYNRKIITCLESLKSLGVSIAIDDFGKEYSNLWCITRLPFDSMKLDKSFIDEINSNLKVNSIIETIMLLSKNLNLRVVAEGIETKEQFDFLQKQGVHEYQGYFFSRPVPAEEVERTFLK